MRGRQAFPLGKVETILGFWSLKVMRRGKEREKLPQKNGVDHSTPFSKKYLCSGQNTLTTALRQNCLPQF